MTGVQTCALPILTQLETGANTLSSGVDSLRQGVDLLNTKMNELSIGANTLKDGMTTLNTGIETFNKEGIQKLTKVASNMSGLSKSAKGLVELSNEYQSFASKQEDTEGNTKFVFVVDSVKAPKEEKKVIPGKKKETFFDRIKNLFK